MEGGIESLTGQPLVVETVGRVRIAQRIDGGLSGGRGVVSGYFESVPQTERPESVLDESLEDGYGDQSIMHLKCSGCESNSLHLMDRFAQGVP